MRTDDSAATRFRRSPDVVERHLGGEVVLLLPGGDATILAGGGAAVWAAVGTECLGLDDICARVFAGASDPEESGIVREMVEVLVGHGALVAR